MTKKKRYALIGAGVFLSIAAVAIWIAAHKFAKSFEPYIRQQAIEYLRTRFDCEVELAALRVNMPNMSALKLFRTRGRGVIVRVDGEGIAMRFEGRRDLPPLFTIKKFGFDVDLGAVLAREKTVRQVTLDGMEIHVPPKGERPKLTKDESLGHSSADTDVIIEYVVINDAKLVLLPKKEGKAPLQFDIHRVHLESAGKDVAMQYDAALTNAKPPGEILSRGTFGPWVAKEPGDTPLAGNYTFDDADLGVFKSIAGILHSTGSFSGTLSSVDVVGNASVPDFRLKISGNRVPLTTRFQVLVDGTNGDTILKPVVARLGATDFTTSGGVIKNEAEHRRAISLHVDMPKGYIQDLLRLAMKGKPFMSGRIRLKTKIDIPPLDGKVKDKLILDGRFDVIDGKFLSSKIQDKIDSLSRRGRGEPKNEAIDEVVSDMNGVFHLEDQVISFKSLRFEVPGAQIELAGAYVFDGPIDFHGAMKLKAKVSETMTGWKRWVLKPIDPFFSREGAGTFLRIKVEGTADDPQFGLDRDRKKAEDHLQLMKPR